MYKYDQLSSCAHQITHTEREQIGLEYKRLKQEIIRERYKEKYELGIPAFVPDFYIFWYLSWSLSLGS